MADKTIEVELVSKADLSGAEELADKVNEIKEAVGEGIDLSSLTSQFQEATEEVERLTDELANIEMGASDADFEEVSAALEEATSKAEELSDALSNLDASGASGASDEISNIGDSAESATESVQGLQDSMGLLEAGALMSISSELSNLGSQAEGMAQEMNTAAISVGQLSTNVGMAEPQMVSLINNISNATFPQNEAMAYVNVLNQMGVSADKLGSSATNMDRINDATQMGYSNVMQLTQGLQAVGISADNLPESFNALAYAESNVGGGAQTLQQVLKTQAGTINEYGLNVDQLVVGLSGLQSQTGLTGRKLSSEFGTRLKECNGDIGQLEQSLGLAAGSLSNADQATGQYSGTLQQLADEEAEHKTIVDQLSAAWEDFALSNSGVLEPLSSAMGLIGQAGSYAVGINGLAQLGSNMRNLATMTNLKAAADKVAAAAQWLLNAAMDANPVMLVVIAIAALVAALVWAYYNVDWFREMVDNAWATLQQFASQIYGAVAGAIQWLGDLFNDFTSSLGLNTSDWRQAILGFIAFIPQLPLIVGQYLVDTIAKALGFGDNFTQNMINSAMNGVNGFISFIVSLPERVATYLSEVITNVINFGSDLLSNVDSTVNWISSSILQAGDIIWGAITTVAENIMTTVQEVWDYITTLGGLIPENASLTGNSIIDATIAVLAFLGTLPVQIAIIFINIIAQVLGFGDNFVQNLMMSAVNAVSGFVGQISSLPGRAASILSSVVSRAISFAGNFASNIASAATNAASRFASGISSMASGLQSELNNMLSAVGQWAATLPQKFWDAGVDAVKNFLDALGIHSPGTMQRMLVWEISEMGRRTPIEGKELIYNLDKLATEAVDTFNPQLSIDNTNLDIDFGDTANASISAIAGSSTDGAGMGNSYVFNFNDTVIDNEDRMEAIADYITRKLAFDNATAGRTV